MCQTGFSNSKTGNFWDREPPDTKLIFEKSSSRNSMKSQLVHLNDENRQKMNANLRMVCALLFLICVALPAVAQKFNGSLRGVVSDRSGAVVAGASVTITNKA